VYNSLIFQLILEAKAGGLRNPQTLLKKKKQNIDKKRAVNITVTSFCMVKMYERFDGRSILN
jgi:hypothetical protein